jgi:hypothetical protein
MGVDSTSASLSPSPMRYKMAKLFGVAGKDLAKLFDLAKIKTRKSNQNNTKSEHINHTSIK